jgi:hypothetical protein
MAKKQSFLDKSSKKAMHPTCPVCAGELSYVRHVKAIKSEEGAWKFRSLNTAVCKCNEKEVYA